MSHEAIGSEAFSDEVTDVDIRVVSSSLSASRWAFGSQATLDNAVQDDIASPKIPWVARPARQGRARPDYGR